MSGEKQQLAEWQAWWRGDLLREPRRPPPPPEPDYFNIFDCLNSQRCTQAKLMEELRRHHGITYFLSHLLQPGGHEGWQLVLRRAKPGRVTEGGAEVVEEAYQEEVERHGKRGAIKRVAKRFNVSPEAVRSALRREKLRYEQFLKSIGSGRK